MSRHLHQKAAPGRHVINPATGLPLAAGGERVTLSSFWRRRLADGDVVAVRALAAPKPASAPAPAPPSKKAEK